MTAVDPGTAATSSTTGPAGAPAHPETGAPVLLPVADGPRVRAVVAGLLRPRRALAAGSFAVLVVGTAVGLLTQPLLGRIVDEVVGRGAFGTVLVLAGVIAAVSVGEALLTTAGLALVARLGESMLADLRERFVDRALHLPLETVERAGSGDLTSRVTSDVEKVAEGVRDALPEFSRAALTIGLTLVGLGVLDWRFMPAALVALPVQAWTVRWYLRSAGPVYAFQRRMSGEQQQQLLETVGGAATVRAFRIAGRQLDRVEERSGRTVGASLAGIRLMTNFFARLNLAEFLGLSAVLVVGYLLVRDGSATVGTATAAALYFHGLFGPINTALSLVDDAQSAFAGLARMVGVVDIPAQHRPHAGTDAGDATIRVSGVHHAYPDGPEVLGGVDLVVPAGRRVALVGASGAGKTTLAKLVAGIHTPTRGSVRTGGTVALVTQEVHVFAGPLADDLRLARADASDEELDAALERVGALTWVQALPDGLATVVGDGGHDLTVAQQQHLALARLVLADPPIAILDEATAEAGSAGARVLERAALAALEGRTSVVVAHRLTQAATADHVVVLERGRVVEQGSHAELVAAGGRYAELWQAWSAPPG
jgi:ATP-binding cassette subfamily C protein